MEFESQRDADNFFMQRAQRIQTTSHDPKALLVPNSAVGAVITKNNDEISKSANVLYDKKNINRCISENERYILIEHAERSAIYNAARSGIKLDNSTMYVTRFPCIDCARAITMSGIKRLVVYKEINMIDGWVEKQLKAKSMLLDAEIEIDYYIK